MARYIFDIETDGLLPELTKIHSLVLKDIDTGEVFSCAAARNGESPGGEWSDIGLGLKLLADADLIVGHSIIDFDLHAIKKVYPEWTTRAQVRDTVVMSRLFWPSDLLKAIDHAKKRVPGKLTGKHKLEAWGHRLMEYKGDFKGPWHTWTQEMQDYCVQDVEVTHKLWNLLVSKQYSEQAIQLEHDVQEIISLQVQAGVPFDMDGARSLYGDLVQLRMQLNKECQALFPSWEIRTPFTPKANNKTRGYVKGVQIEKVKVMEFKPTSGDHIADRLIKLRGWKPEAYGKDGKPTVDEAVLAALDYPEVPLLLRFTMIQKRIGLLAEGRKALMKSVRPDGRIHGGVVVNGTVTGRMAHFGPNLGQIPKVKKSKTKGVLKGEEGDFGFEFRSLFYAPKGWRMVGVDESGLELRMLGHYMARWDDGAYAREVVGGDVHTLHQTTLGIASRDDGKTWTYAWLYGAGDEKLGKILKILSGKSADETKRKRITAGRASRAKFLTKLPALKFLIDACRSKHRSQKHVRGLDGRMIHTRSDHSSLNSLLQSAGAIVCKVWIVTLHRRLRERGFEWGRDFQHLLTIHDEVQILAREEIADEVGKIAADAAREAGEILGLRVPTAGEYKVGNRWSETH